METINYKGYTIEIKPDENPNNPLEDDNFGTIVCFHKRYKLGDKTNIKSDDFSSWNELETHICQELKAAVILPVYMYDHSGITINTTGFSCPWDSGQIGFIYATKKDILDNWGGKVLTPKLREKAETLLRGEVETYDQYLRGDICGFIITKDGEDIDSCWGFYGEDEAMKRAKGIVDYQDKKVKV
jgi:hypothetical protein